MLLVLWRWYLLKISVYICIFSFFSFQALRTVYNPLGYICFGFCSPLVTYQLNKDYKINFGCMQCWFHSFVHYGLAHFVLCKWNILCLTSKDLYDVLYTIPWCCMLSVLNSICFNDHYYFILFTVLLVLFVSSFLSGCSKPSIFLQETPSAWVR